MISKLRYLIKDGFFHILGSTFVNKIIAFLTNILLVRILTKTDYGIFTSSFNVFYIVFIFSGLGIISGILYYCSKDIAREEKIAYYRFSFKFGLASEFILSLILLVYSLFGQVGIEETRKYILALAGLPFIAFLYDYYSIILRAEKNNVSYSRLMNLNSLLYLIFAVIGAFFGGIIGTIVGRYLAYLISDIVGALLCRKYLVSSKSMILNRFQITDITKYSLKAGITSSLNVILYRIDVAIIAVVIADASILASYKIGTALPENVNFIPQCIMVYFLPVFINHLSDTNWVKQKVKELYLFIGVLSFVIGVGIIVFSPQIIVLLWGKNYLDAIPCMRILAVSFMVLSTFRITSTNILLALKKVGYTMFISVFTGLTNIVLDVLLTIKYGSIGAAYATLIVTVLASVVSFPYVMYTIYSGKRSYE